MLPCRGLIRRPMSPTFRFQARRGICQPLSNGNFRKVRLRSAAEVKRGLEILLSILKEPSLGEQLRELELDLTPLSLYRPYGRPYEIQSKRVLLPTEDLQRLQAAVRNAGFEGQEEHQRVLNMLLQDVNESQEYVIHSR